MNTDSPHQAEEIREELKETPFLQQLPKQGFLQAPEGYFDTLGEHLQAKITEEKNLAEEAPTLSSISREPFFSAPEGYFQQLPAQLLQQINAADSTPALRRPLWRRPAIIMGIAAAIACLLLFRFWQAPSPSEEGWSEIPTGELLAMVETEPISTELLLDVLGEESLDTFEDLKAEEISEEELSEYLEAIDLEELEANWLE